MIALAPPRQSNGSEVRPSPRDPMRVLFFTNNFPRPSDPFRSVFNKRLFDVLAARHDVRVVSPVAWTDRWPFAASRGEDAHDPRFTYPSYYFPPRILLPERGRFMWWSLRGHLARVTRDWSPDVVLAYWTHPDGEVALRVARRAGVPAIQMVGGSDVLQYPRGSVRWKRVCRVLRNVDAVITMGDHLAREVVSLGVRPDRVTTLYRPVDATRFSPGAAGDARAALGLPVHQPVVLWVGRFHPVKDVGTLLDAVATLRKNVPDLAVFLVGKGAEEETLRARAQALQLDEVVRFVGPVAPDALVNWYRAADVVVLPSLWEGVPNVLLEAISCGVPFVASAVGGIPEIADPELDCLVPPKDPASLASGVERVLARRTGERPARRLPSTTASFVNDFERVLDSVVSRQPA